MNVFMSVPHKRLYNHFFFFQEVENLKTKQKCHPLVLYFTSQKALCLTCSSVMHCLLFQFVKDMYSNEIWHSNNQYVTDNLTNINSQCININISMDSKQKYTFPNKTLYAYCKISKISLNQYFIYILQWLDFKCKAFLTS